MISKTERKKIRRYLEKFPVAGSIFLRVYKLFRSITFASLHELRKSATGNTQCRLKTRALSNKRNWDFFSGERQTAECVDKIRKDHVNRYMYISNFIKNNVNATKLVSILDIFCGNGYGSYILASEIENATVDAIDGSKEAMDFAKKKIESEKVMYHHYGFPTGSCVEAGLCNVAVFCTDELNLNIKFANHYDICIIPRNIEEICAIILSYYNNPNRLYELSQNCQKSFFEVFDLETQMNQRIKVLKSYL